MISVSVMYSDLTIQEEEIDDIGLLPKDNVLFVVVNTDAVDPATEEEYGRVSQKSGFDHYALCIKVDGGSDWVMLNGWDEGDWVWRRLDNPWEYPNAWDVLEIAPIGIMNVVFHGVAVDAETWADAITKFDEEM